MKFPLTIIFLLITPLLFAQQNLVPNWSFEELLVCPTADVTPVYQSAYPWFSPTGGTPDIFNICNTLTSGTCVPFNAWGYQQAHSGNGYGGFARYIVDNIVEYFSIKLTSPLKEGQKYCISFYVNPGNHTAQVTDAIGAYLSVDSIHVSGYSVLPFIPQVENPFGNVISDTINWALISAEYIAMGGEQFITIGSFYDDSIIQWEINDTIYPAYSWPYYYLDDVSVYYCGPDTTIIPPSENSLTIPNAFTPNNDNYNDNFIIKGQNIKSVNGKILNRWGQELFSFANLTVSWDGKYKGNDVSEGVYFYFIIVNYIDGKSETKHGSIEVVK